MKAFNSCLALTLMPVFACQAADWKPQDVHPKVFQMVDAWVSDTAAPVITEINLDAVKSNRNQFDTSAVRNESGWITYREGSDMLRFKLGATTDGQYSVRYQENGGGSLTTERTIRFTIAPRKVRVNGRETDVSVLRVHSISN